MGVLMGMFFFEGVWNIFFQEYFWDEKFDKCILDALI